MTIFFWNYSLHWHWFLYDFNDDDDNNGNRLAWFHDTVTFTQSTRHKMESFHWKQNEFQYETDAGKKSAIRLRWIKKSNHFRRLFILFDCHFEKRFCLIPLFIIEQETFLWKGVSQIYIKSYLSRRFPSFFSFFN